MSSDAQPRSGPRHPRRLLVIWVLSLLPFCLLATANSAGYRYGASDLAFYGPAVMHELEPHLFPRDAPLIEAQARLTLMDETVAAIAEVTTDHFPRLFLGLYLVTLAGLAFGAAAIGTRLYRSSWAVAALLAALSLRHAIHSSGTNTLEGYFHPRQLAFACGVLAVAAFLRHRTAPALAALLAAAALHPTTALWFGIWLGVAMFVSERSWRGPIAAATAVLALSASWAALAGPLAGRLVVMDEAWLATIADKDYLFPLSWPVDAWMINLGYVPLIWLIYRWRRASGLLEARETGLVLGCLALVPVFLLFLAMHAARIALAVQLQPARVFWLLDFLALVYAVWALAEGARLSVPRARVAAAALFVVSVLRGGYVMQLEFPDRPLFQVDVPGDWGRVAAWAQSTRPDSGWLADPMHATLYGTSLRMAAERDVFVEAVKDGAIGMYDRTIALRTRARVEAVGDFRRLSAARARQLGAQHSLDYLVTEQRVALPLAFQSGRIRVYALSE
jgi:hypothetical protein